MCLGGDEWGTFFNLGKQSNFFQSVKMAENFFAEKYKNESLNMRYTQKA